MSLKLWLKLNGDLKDHSGNYPNFTASVSGTNQFSSDGLVMSSSFNFNGATTLYNMPFGSDLSAGDFTMFARFKTSGLGSGQTLGGIISLGYGNLLYFDDGKNLSAVLYAYKTNQGQIGSVNVNIPSLFDNTWKSVAVTYSNRNLKLFLDGVLIGETTTIQDYKTSYINATIGNNPNTSMYNFYGQMQDVRIYDHCLSDKEIYDISKALCLHYTFDDVEEPTVNLAYNQTLLSYSKYHTLTQDGLNKITMVINSIPSYLTIRHWFNPIGKTITASGYLKLNGIPLSLHFTRLSTYQSSAALSKSDASTGRFEVTQYYDKDNITNDWLIHAYLSTAIETLKVGDIITIEKFQVEEKDHATPFVNGTRDNIVVRDKSDYRNDSLPLTISNTPAFVDDCKIGRLSGKNLDNTLDTYIDTGFNLYGKTTFSVSSWIKQEKDNSIIIGDHYHGNMYESVRIGTGHIAINGSSGVSLRSTMPTVNTFPLNEWSHFAFTYDYSSRVGKLYKNGVLVRTMTILDNSIPYNSGRTLRIFKETGVEPNASEQALKGNLDDLRIYATALTAEDIKEIYQSRANLDDKGNLQVQGQFNEETGSFFSIKENGDCFSDALSEVGVTDGLIAWYPLNGDARDYSGNGNDGTVVGATVSSGLGQKCYNFDGVDDYITLGNVSLLKQTESFSIDFFAYLNDWSLSSQHKFISCTEAGGYNFSLNDAGAIDCVSFQLYTGGSYKYVKLSKTSFSSGWHKITGIYNKESSLLLLYVDGTLVGSVPCAGTATYANNSVFIAAEAGSTSTPFGNYLNGKIQDVRIYNRALTPEEVMINYNLTKADKTAMIQADNGTTYLKEIKEI